MDPDPEERELAPTAGLDYAERLYDISNVWWKRLLHVQAPYQANIRRFDLGRTIDVGCGIGRNLKTLAPGSVGVDHNPYAIEVARRTGVAAYTDDEFFADPDLARPDSFDGMLVAHVIEHLTPQDARSILGMYLPLVHPGGRIAFITPQERGYASDHTHITFTGFEELRALADDLGLITVRNASFPFPRWAGKAFVYNEFVLLARKPV
ncbi:class I SAM-dependent methyltransferase [Cellulomonas sp. P5_C6]